ncbi:hypothetical protein HZS_59, partial [Henneguya salminicola]
MSSNSTKRKFKIFVGSSNPLLGKIICDELGIEQGEVNCGFFMNGETRVEIMQSVRGLDVFLIQTGSLPINDNLMELLVMIHCCKFASASRITAVIPCYFYARQDKKDRSRAPITAKLVASMLTTAGADHVITMDLHASQIQGFFDIPVDNLLAEPLFVNWIKKHIPDYQSTILISPDAGGVKRVASIADFLKIEFALIHKERRIANEVSNMIIVGNVDGKDVILVDDMADTCGTIIKASIKLKEAGANKIYAMCVHGIFSGDAAEKLKKSPIDTILVTNTIYNQRIIEKLKNIEIIDVGPIFAEAIRRTENNESISFLFKNLVKCKK